jgi:hypothetical protein
MNNNTKKKFVALTRKDRAEQVSNANPRNPRNTKGKVAGKRGSKNHRDDEN